MENVLKIEGVKKICLNVFVFLQRVHSFSYSLYNTHAKHIVSKLIVTSVTELYKAANTTMQDILNK